MESFIYTARDLSGDEQKGRMRAESEHAVYARLNADGLVPVKVAPASKKVATSLTFGNDRKVKSGELSAFCWQFATMIEGGVLITEAIDTVSEDIENPSFKRVLAEVSDQIKKGQSLSMSISKYPKVFNKLFRAMIVAGESSGSMHVILERLATYFENKDKFDKKLQGALAYPMFTLAFVFVILIVMMTLIIPKFRLIFDSMGDKLPPFTKAFLGFYDNAASNIGYIIAITAIVTGAGIVYNKTREGHTKLCALLLKMPLFGPLNVQAFVTTFCRTMATLLSAGVSIIDAFDILSDMTNNDVIRNAILRSKERMIEGTSIHGALEGNDFFPNMVTRMVQVGEKTGSLPKSMDRASNFYESKMDATITTMLNLLGPAVIVVVGAIVLVIVIALYLPIFTMSDF
jgi:type IV pilus assembly protein PilC